MMNNKIVLVGVGAVLVLGALVMTARSNQEAKALKSQLEELQKQSPQAAQDEVKKLVEEVGMLIALPEGETPTVATITDKEKLGDVPFFAKAENGDKVLLYVNNRKGYLYRPGGKKVIDVATLNLNNAQQNFVAKVALRNGTATEGLTKTFEDQLKQVLPKAEVVSRDNAKNTTFTDTIVVDLTGSKKNDAQNLATAVAGKVGTLPADETKPSGADFLIILGSDKVKAAVSVTSTPTPTRNP